MAKASDNPFPSILLVEQASAPATPSSGQARLYRKTDNKLYVKDDGGTETEVGGGGTGTDSGWITVSSFSDTWTNYGSGEQAAAYRKINGVVYLQGLIRSGTVGNAAFVLPSGYRPGATGGGTNPIMFPTISNATIGRVTVGLDGTVAPQLPSNTAYVSLNGIAFPAA